MKDYVALHAGEFIKIYSMSANYTPHIMDVRLEIDSIECENTYLITYNGGIMAHVIPENKSRSAWFFHNENDPAIINHPHECVRFFINGTSVKINDLKCDEETKVLLSLRHVYDGVTKAGYHSYGL